MPIKSENMGKYPGGSTASPEWQAIRAFVRARAGDQCEKCGVRNLTYGVRMEEDFTDLGLDKAEALIEYEYAVGIAGLLTGRDDLLRLLPKMIRIVCTVAHIDHSLTNHSTTNLAFWCQKCHNTWDSGQRKKNRAETLSRKKNNYDLFLGECR